MSRQKVPFVKVKPKKVKDAVWSMVVEAWENGLSDREASFRVQKFLGEDLKADDIRFWCKDYPEVGELRANLQNDVLMNSKISRPLNGMRSARVRTNSVQSRL